MSVGDAHKPACDDGIDNRRNSMVPLTRAVIMLHTHTHMQTYTQTCRHTYKHTVKLYVY